MITLILITTVLAVLIIRQYQRTRHLPPGPVPLPLIGNVHQLFYRVYKEKGIVSAFNYYRKKYGEIFTLWIGPVAYVSIADYDVAQDVFVRNGNKYKDRLMVPMFEYHSKGSGLLNSNGAGWEEARRFTLLAFRTMGVGRDLLEERILSELDLRCSELDAAAVDGKTLVLTSEFFDLTVGSVINSILVGQRYEEHNKSSFLELKRLFDSSAETFTFLDLTLPVWVLKTFCPSRLARNMKTRQGIMDHVSKEAVKRFEELETGKYTLDPENPRDVVDAYFLKIQEEGERGNERVYTLENLKPLLMDLWIGGLGTTSTTLVAACSRLVGHPDVLNRLRQELMTVTYGGSRNLSLQDKPNTPYLNAVLAEVQRLASVVSVNFWRMNNEPIQVGKYRVDAGAVITAQLSAYHGNENVFENPDDFDPDRFYKNDKLMSQLIPFGIGKRSCVGEFIARTELYLMLGNLVLRYDFKPHGSIPKNFDAYPFSSAKVPDTTVQLEFVKIK